MGLVAAAATAAAARATAPAAATVAAAATAAAAATPTVAAAAPAAAATVTTAAAGFLGLGLVDGEVTAVVLGAVEGVDRGSRFFVRAHLDEAEALASAALAVLDDLGALHLPVGAE